MIKQTVEERTKIVTTNFTANQLIQLVYNIFECVELNLSFILNVMRNVQLHTMFNTFVGYDFYSYGVQSRFFKTRSSPRMKQVWKCCVEERPFLRFFKAYIFFRHEMGGAYGTYGGEERRIQGFDEETWKKETTWEPQA
jgi:hypothetical protein